MNILDALKDERAKIKVRLHGVNTAINAVTGSRESHTDNGSKPTHRRMSAKGRAAIAKAARDRWTRYRAAKKKQ